MTTGLPTDEDVGAATAASFKRTMSLSDAVQRLADLEENLQRALELEAKAEAVKEIVGHEGHVAGNVDDLRSCREVDSLIEADRGLQLLSWYQAVQVLGSEAAKLLQSPLFLQARSTNVSAGNFKGLGSGANLASGANGAGGNALVRVDRWALEEAVRVHAVLAAICRPLQSSSCKNLTSYATATLTFVRRTFVPKLEDLLLQLAEQVGFPQCVLDPPQKTDFPQVAWRSGGGGGSSKSSCVPDFPAEKVDEFKAVFSALKRLSSDDISKNQDDEDNARKFHLAGGGDPVRALAQPLQKRFRFHFTGDRKTNVPFKPEWYLQQVGTWMQRSRTFFEICCCDDVDEMTAPSGRAGKVNADGSQRHHSAFCSHLLSLVNAKMKQDLPLFLDTDDDVHLSHLIDEVLMFSKEIASPADFGVNVSPEDMPLNILREPAVANRWIDLERKFAFEKVDEMMLKDGGSWNSISREAVGGGDDNAANEVSRCAETFVALLQSITNRYKLLTYVDDVSLQLRFVDLQVELLEDMRLRFAQVIRQESQQSGLQPFPLSEKFCLILNSAQFLSDVFNSWSELPLFLKLRYEVLQLQQQQLDQQQLSHQTVSLETFPFGAAINGFDFLVADLVKTIGDHIAGVAKARGRSYCKDIRWFSYTNSLTTETDPSMRIPELSTESLGIFQVLACSLEMVGKTLNPKLLGRVVKRVSELMDEFFILDVILENDFSPDGCKQMEVDVNRGLRAIFNQYPAFDPKPKDYWQLPQVIRLLNLERANALLLLDTLEREIVKSASFDQDKALKSHPKGHSGDSSCHSVPCLETTKSQKPEVLLEFKIDNLTAEQATKVLKRRIDLQ